MTSAHTDVTKGNLLDLLRTIANLLLKHVEAIQAGADSVRIKLSVSFYSGTQKHGKSLPSLGPVMVMMNRLPMTFLMEFFY